MLGYVSVFATPNPPVPNGRNQGTPPPPPGLPIDEHLPFLLLFAIVFGMYIVYNQTLKKNSILI